MKKETLVSGPILSFLLIILCVGLSTTSIAQVRLNLSNDTRANHHYCDHDGTFFKGCGVTYTDDGGPGLYQADLIDTHMNPTYDYGDDAYEPTFWTFCPTDPIEERIRLTFTEFNIHSSDHFYVYDGPCSLANGDRNEAIGFPGQDDDQTLNANDFIRLTGATTAEMSIAAGNGTAEFGAGWVSASCNNASGCITIGWNPDGDGNKGNGWTFTTSCKPRNAGMVCHTTAGDTPSPLLSYDGLTIGCGEGIDLPIPPPFLLGCAATGPNTNQSLSTPYFIEIFLNGNPLGFVGGTNSTYPEVNVGVGRHKVTYILYFNEAETGSRRLIELEQLECSFTIFDAQNLVCKAAVNISLGDDCGSTLIPDDVVDTECAPAFPLSLRLDGRQYTSICGTCEFTDPAREKLILEEGTYEFIIGDQCNNACFGEINLRDIQGPQCNMPIITGQLCSVPLERMDPNFLDCNQILETSVKETVLGSCGVFSSTEVSILAEELQIVEATAFTTLGTNAFVLTGSGASIGAAVLNGQSTFDNIIVRRWRAVDSKGNVTENCPQIIPIIRPDTLFMPSPTIEINCGEDITPAGLFNLTHVNGTRRFRKSDIAPWFNSPVAGEGNSIEYILPNENPACNYATSYTDQLVQTIGNTQKIARTWTWLDWCASTPSRTPPFTQVIKIVDKVEPILTKNPNEMQRSADLFECSGNITLDRAEWEDLCGEIVSYRTEIRSIKSNGDIGYVIWENSENGGAFDNVDLGCYYVLYYATDTDGNETSTFGESDNPWAPIPDNVGITTLCVEDDIKPQARCLDKVNIALRSSSDRIFARDVDLGSSDNCGVELLEVSFNENGGDYASFLEIGCENVSQQLKIYLKVTDKNGNVNKCFGNATIMPDAHNTHCEEVEAARFNIRGKINSANNQTINSVLLNIDSEAEVFSTTSDGTGTYTTSLPRGATYSITPQKKDDILVGVSTFDLVTISKHVLGVTPFTSPYQYIAADVNKSGTVTTFDIILLRQLILNITADFPQDNAWRFVDASYDFGSDISSTLLQNFRESIDLAPLTTNLESVDFIGVKIGDVNTSVLSRTVTDTMHVSTINHFVQEGEVFSVPFLTNNMPEIQGFQFTLDYENLDLLYISEGIAKEEHIHSGIEGIITTSWNASQKVEEEPILFIANFRATTSGYIQDFLHLNSTIVPSEAYATSDSLMAVSIEFLTDHLFQPTGTTPSTQFQLFQNAPNPFAENTAINFILPISEQVELVILDGQGKLLKNFLIDGVKGYNTITLSQKDFDRGGLYYYYLKSQHQVVGKKMSIFK